MGARLVGHRGILPVGGAGWANLARIDTDLASLAVSFGHLLHTAGVCVEHYPPRPGGSWIYREHKGIDQSVTILSIEHVMNHSAVYESILEIPA